jgi:hypothetical protein
MKQLLTDCKKALRDTLAYIRNSDIYITEDIRMVRNAGAYPAIGIKDGGFRYGVETSDQGDVTYSVTFAAYVSLTRQEAGIMGVAGQKGVLDLATEIIACITGEAFNGRFDAVRVISCGESEVIGDETRALNMLPIKFEFDIYS